MTTIRNTTFMLNSIHRFLSNKFLYAAVMAQMALISLDIRAQDGTFRMPEATIPGVTEDASADNVVVGLLKYTGLIVIWILVMLMAFTLVKNIVKSFNKVRRDESTQWSDVIGDVVGNALGTLGVVVLGGWVTTYLT